MAGAAPQGELVSAINVTPFVDVVLVLLVGLMVAATDMATPSIAVDLPHAATGKDAPPRPLAITIDSTGALFLDGTPIDDEGLRRAAREAAAASTDTSAAIAADGRVPHARVVHVVDLLRQESVVHFALQVDPEG